MNTPLRALSLSAALLACGAFGFFARDLQGKKPPSVEALRRLVGAKPTPARLNAEGVFRENYSRIATDYEKPIKAETLRYAGFGGMLASLGDPHTIFLPPRAAQEFNDETRANFFGVGARLGTDPLGAKASEVFDDGPAYKSGLRKGAIITGVDGKSVVGLGIDKIVAKIKGPEGTVVRLSVIQSGNPKAVTLTIRRARVTTPTVSGDVVPGTPFGYLMVSQFSEPTAMQFDKTLATLESQGIKGLVIDLRGNPGGLLTTAADMVGRFVSDKTVVTMRFRDGNEEVQRSTRGSRPRVRLPRRCPGRRRLGERGGDLLRMPEGLWEGHPHRHPHLR